jgi:chitodextrinase
MISVSRFFTINRNIGAAITISFMVSACGGGGGAGGSGESFGSTPNNAKPQSSAVATSAQSSDAGEITQTSSSATITSSSSSKSSSKSSSSSKRSTSSTAIDLTAPTAPGKISTAALYNRVALSWGPSLDNVGVVYYRIYRDQALIDTLWAPEDSFVDFDVAPNRTYTYSISAGDAVNNWSPLTSTDVQTPSAPVQSANSTSSRATSSAANTSSTSSARTSSNGSTSSVTSSSTSKSSSSRSSTPVDTTAPSIPTNLHQDAALASHVDISWTAATDNTGVTSYRVYRDNTVIGTVNADTLSFSDASVQASHQYLYGVSAGDAAGNWSAQQTLFVSTPAASNSGDVTLLWLTPIQRVNGAALSLSELSGFELRYKRQTDTEFTYVSLSKLTLLYVIPNLLGDYQFEIAAIDTNNLYSEFKPLTPQ